MPRLVLKNVQVHGKGRPLPRIIDLEIYWPVAGADMEEPCSKPFCLRYVDAAEEGTRVWDEAGRYMSLSGAERDASAMVGRDISNDPWQRLADPENTH